MPATALPPDFLAHRYDPGHDAFHFIEAERERRRAVPFLIDEHLPGAATPLVVRRAEAMKTHAGGARLNFVFHSAYCCSTLLANAYDRPGTAFSLKEPLLLNDLVGWRHRGGAPEAIGEVLRDSLRLLARPFAADEVGVVKPSNVVNALIPAIVQLRPDAGVLLLHAPLATYLGSIAGKGLWGRRWVRDLLMKQLTDGIVHLGFERDDYLLLTDLQVAAVGWLAQHAIFADTATRWPARVRTLDSEVLLRHPAASLAALDRLFGVDAGDEARATIVATEFHRHAKFGSDFTVADRIADQQSAASAHGDEVEKVAIWARAVADNVGLTLALPQPLLD